MKLKAPVTTRRPEPDLTSLINIVFLILIFFIVAGTLRPFSARDIQLARTQPDSAGVSVPANLIAHADGRVTYRGEVVPLEELGTRISRDRNNAERAPLTIVADARLNAKRLLEIMRTVRGPGVGEISILTEQLREK